MPCAHQAPTALALTGIGTALVVGFQVPETTAVTTTVATSGSSTTSATTSGSTSTPAAAASPATTTASGTASATETPAATESTTTTTTVTTATAATYADGTYTGTAVEEPWGTFQVQAVVSGGVLTDVVIVTAPQDGPQQPDQQPGDPGPL